MRGLPRIGHPACTVDLPRRAMGDLQRSSEYVVRSIRLLARRSGGRIDVVGHSQGGVLPLWALRWWPKLRDAVRRYVGIGTGGRGLDYLRPVCGVGRLCPPAFWQLASGSDFFRALNAGVVTPGPTRYTSIMSLTDEVAGPNVGPRPVGLVAGAESVTVQDLCPGRVVNHIAEVYDAAVFALVRDALEHRGPVRLERVGRAPCETSLMPGVRSGGLPVRTGKGGRRPGAGPSRIEACGLGASPVGLRAQGNSSQARDPLRTAPSDERQSRPGRSGYMPTRLASWS